MASKNTISMDVTMAREQAKKLDDIASQIEKMKNGSYTTTLDNLNIAWRGDNATAFIQKGDGVKLELDTVVKKLKKTANAIREIAQNIYDAEQKAAEIAKQRTYTSHSGEDHGGGNGRSF